MEWIHGEGKYMCTVCILSTGSHILVGTSLKSILYKGWDEPQNHSGCGAEEKTVTPVAEIRT
jgi:hypothetical protein